MCRFLLFLLLTVTQTHAGTRKTIYGADNRVSPTAHHDARLKRLSENVVVLFHPQLFVLSLNYCSGFLVSHNKRTYLFTAGHCIADNGCNFRMRTNYEENGGQKETFKCAGVVLNSQKPDIGIAEVKRRNPLDKRPIPGLPLSFVRPQRGDALAVIGHPEGEKMKISDHCQVESLRPNAFTHNCDTFHGNSGSVTFNLTKNYGITGILVSGAADYDRDGRLNVYPVGTAGREVSTNLFTLKDEILRAISQYERTSAQ